MENLIYIYPKIQYQKYSKIPYAFFNQKNPPPNPVPSKNSPLPHNGLQASKTSFLLPKKALGLTILSPFAPPSRYAQRRYCSLYQRCSLPRILPGEFLPLSQICPGYHYHTFALDISDYSRSRRLSSSGS
jgi:hypothetical protein